jgi:hypothetical protein
MSDWLLTYFGCGVGSAYDFVSLEVLPVVWALAKNDCECGWAPWSLRNSAIGGCFKPVSTLAWTFFGSILRNGEGSLLCPSTEATTREGGRAGTYFGGFTYIYFNFWSSFFCVQYRIWSSAALGPNFRWQEGHWMLENILALVATSLWSIYFFKCFLALDSIFSSISAREEQTWSSCVLFVTFWQAISWMPAPNLVVVWFLWIVFGAAPLIGS